MEIILGISINFIVFLTIFLLTIYKVINPKLILKILAIILFVFLVIKINGPRDKLFYVYNVFLLDTDTDIYSRDTWISGMTAFDMAYVVILKWLNSIELILLMISAFYKNKHIKLLSSIFPLIISILTIFAYKTILMGKYSTDTSTFISFLKYLIAFEFSFALFYSLYNTFTYFYLKEYKNYQLKSIWKTILILLVMIPFSLPLYATQIFLGDYGQILADFNNLHLIYILGNFLIIILVYVVLRKASQEDKNCFLVTFSLLSVIIFYQYKMGWDNPQFHLCSIGVVLLFISITFKVNWLFYLCYFANVIGGFGAIVMSDIVTDFYDADSWLYVWNHIYVFVIPILCVALHMFKHPKLKDLVISSGLFTIYFAFVTFINPFFGNFAFFGAKDYFFTNDPFLAESFGILSLWTNPEGIKSVEYYSNIFKRTISMEFHVNFLIVYYIVFIFLMFFLWYVYDAVFQLSSSLRDLKVKRRLVKLDMLNLRLALNGRSPSEPLDLEGSDMIKIVNFSKRYGSSNKYAVKNLNLEIEAGKIYGFLGHNGAGKSTTIKSLVGIQTITEGDMFVDGYSIKTQALEVKRRIGYVSDNHAVYERLTGREYINYIADLYKVNKEDRDTRLNEMLIEFNLIDAIDQEIKSYSHGMKQKIVVIASLIHKPRVWILDEPLTGLDPKSAFQLKNKMFDYARSGNIVFFSSHVIEVVEKICDAIAIINNGSLRGVYDIKELKSKNIELESLYFESPTSATIDSKTTESSELNKENDVINEEKVVINEVSVEDNNVNEVINNDLEKINIIDVQGRKYKLVVNDNKPYLLDLETLQKPVGYQRFICLTWIFENKKTQSLDKNLNTYELIKLIYTLINS